MSCSVVPYISFSLVPVGGERLARVSAPSPLPLASVVVAQALAEQPRVPGELPPQSARAVGLCLAVGAQHLRPSRPLRLPPHPRVALLQKLVVGQTVHLY